MKNLKISVLMTIVTMILMGIIYPLAVTAFAQILFHDKANGQLIQQGSDIVGSRIIGQPFTSDRYFHSRPSAAGNGYDASNSAGSNLGPTNQKLMDRMKADTARLQAENPNTS
ncbi:MAG TPA: potassium-transporting ATPase subunit C, partial [Terriglobales bacterium]